MAAIKMPTISSNELLPLVPPNEQLSAGGGQVAPHDHDLLLAAWPAILDIESRQGHLIQRPGFLPPVVKIIDYDLALLVFAEWWLELVKNGNGDRPIIDLNHFAPRVRNHPAKRCLMSLRGVAWDDQSPRPLRAEWPDDVEDGLRWVTSRFRHHHRSGFVYLPQETGDNGRRAYLPSITRAGLARAVWLATDALPPDIAPEIPALATALKLRMPTS